ncbi:Nad-binding protein [Mycena sanguinolenta]|uniref:Nad-binding protein n=1 Tax=Mycena sanguinolenta TaxID=230812 RepID=A0A8H6Z010_9AGAR|nr:Nad-binding protein [Mycena sanguinolenta]
MTSESNNNDFQLSEVFNVKGKVALVTGGGSGIGLMATQALAVNGAKVYIVGRTKEKLDTVVHQHGQNIAGEIIPLVGDVTKKEGVEQLVKEIESREQCLCILINNAGIAQEEKTIPDGKDAEEVKKNLFRPTSIEEWTSVYATNVVAPYLMTTAFLPLLQRATEQHHGYSGTVINITSISGMLKASQGQFSYNTSKGAFIHLNKMLAAEVAKAGLKIRINGIAPGIFPSEMTTGSSGEDQKSSIPKKEREGLPSGRPGNDRDMAAAVLFAASCQYLNGQNIPVDGGYLIQVGQ